MTDREFINIVLTATDLASRKLNAAAAAIERETAKIEASTKGANKEFDKLGESMDRAGTRSAPLRRSLADVGADMEKAQAKLAGYDSALRRLPDAENLVGRAIQQNRATLLQHIEALRNEQRELEGVEQRVRTLPGAVERLGRSVENLGRSWVSHNRGASAAVRVLGDVANGFSKVDHAASAVEHAVAHAVSGIVSGIGKTTKELEKNAKEADRAVTAWERLGSSWGRASSSIISTGVGLLRTAGGLVASVGVFGLIAVAIGPIAGLAEAGAAGVFALASALSTLSATAVALPAILTAVAGSIAAVTTILKPAVSGVLAYVSAAGKAQQGATGSSGGGSTGTAQTTAQLEKQLHQLRLQNALQEKQAEQSLATLKLNTAQQLIQDQLTLDNLRKQDRITQQQAQSDLTAARQRLRVLQAEHAPQAEIKAAQAEVRQDETNLHVVKLQNSQKEQQAEAKLHSDKRNGLAQIRQAELQLQQLRIQNAQQVAALQKQITQAQTGSNSALSRQADLYKHLTPLQRQLADAILALKKRWDALTVSFKNRFLHELLKDLQDLNAFLPAIAKTVGAFANTITDTVATIRSKLVTPGGQATALGQRVGGFVQFAQRQERVALGLGTAGQAAGGGLLALGEAITRFVTSPPAQQFIHFMAEGVRTLGAWALNAEKAGERTGGIARFFNHAREVARIVGDIIRNLAIAVFNIGKISFPTGRGFLAAIDTLSKRFRAFTETAKGRNEIRKFFDDAREAVRAFDRAVIAIIGNVAKLGRGFTAQSSGGGAPTVRGGQATQGATSVKGASPIAQFFDEVAKVAPKLTQALKQFYAIISAASPLLKEAAGDAREFAGVLKDFAGWLDQHPLEKKIVGWMIVFAVVGPKIIGLIKGFAKPFLEAYKAGKWLFEGKKLADGTKDVSRFGKAVDKIKGFGGKLFDGLKGAVETTGGKFKAAAGHVGDFVRHVGDLSKKGIKTAAESLKTFGSRAATAATDAGKFVTQVGKNSLKALADFAKAAGGAALSALKGFAVMVGETVVGALQAMAVALGIATVDEEGFTLALSATGIGAIIIVIGLLIAAIILIATHWKQTKRIVVEGVKEIWHLMQEAWGEIKHLTSEAWSAVKGFIEKLWQDIILFFAGPLGIAGLLSKFVGGPGAIWDKLKSVASTAWDAIKTVITTAWDGIVKFFTDTAPGKIKTAFTSIWNEVAHVSAIAINRIIGVIDGFLNGIGGGIDFVLRHIGLSDHQLHIHDPIGKLPIPDAAEGGIFRAVPGGMYRFVEAGHPEAVVPLDPSKRDRAFEIMRQIARQMGDVPGFAGGGIAGGGSTGQKPSPDPITSAIGGVFSTIGDWISSVKAQLPSIPHIAGEIGHMASGAAGFLKDKVVGWAEGKFSSLLGRFLPSSEIGGQPITPQTIRGLELKHLIDTGMRYLGQDWGTAPASAALHPYPAGKPPWGRQLSGNELERVARLALGLYNRTKQSDLVALFGRALQESGGYTSVINQWDPNWLAGTPSIGLLQTIAPTFASYARKPFTNIWDPLHNAVAAIGYMLHNYHRIVGASGSGYALGGMVGDHKLGQTAGVREGQPVRILAHVGEWVLNRDQQDKLAHLFGSRDKAFHALFNQPSFGNMFAAGGLVTGVGAAPVAASGGAHVTVGPIYTTSPKIDIEYVSRALEARLGRF